MTPRNMQVYCTKPEEESTKGLMVHTHTYTCTHTTLYFTVDFTFSPFADDFNHCKQFDPGFKLLDTDDIPDFE